MSRTNYSTTRNKPVILDSSIRFEAFKLNSSYVSKLGQRQRSFNDWEKGFYRSLKHNSFKIVSGKQWQTVKGLIEKYKPNISPAYSSAKNIAIY